MPLYVPGYYNHNKTDTAQHFNLSVQRQLDKSTVLTVAYVGTLAHHIEHAVLCSTVIRPSACRWRVADRMPRLASTRRTAQTIYGTLVGPIDNQTISPNYHNSSGGPVVAFAESEYVQNSGNSNYNSLQVSAERRARDVTYLLSYTYSKSLDDVGALWDPRDPNRNYGQSSWDMRHNFVASYNWNLPFARFYGTPPVQRRVAHHWHQPLQHRVPSQPAE